MKEIYLIRHGESEGNIDKEIYRHKPDYALRLTQNGYKQAVNLGRNIGENILEYSSEPVYFYTSPFYRARDTFQGIITGMSESIIKKYEVENPQYLINSWKKIAMKIPVCGSKNGGKFQERISAKIQKWKGIILVHITIVFRAAKAAQT